MILGIAGVVRGDGAELLAPLGGLRGNLLGAGDLASDIARRLLRLPDFVIGGIEKLGASKDGLSEVG